MQFLSNTMLPLIGTFLTGVLGWIIANFAAEPILRLSRIRRDVREAVFYTKNIGEISSADACTEANSELRRLAARLDAVATDAWPIIKWGWKLRGYDLSRAVAGLTGLSNSLSTKRGEKAIHCHDVEKGLRFPLEYSATEIQEIQRIRNRSN